MGIHLSRESLDWAGILGSLESPGSHVRKDSPKEGD